MATSVDAKLLKSTKFPVEFNQKVDMQKVNVEVLKKWALPPHQGIGRANSVLRYRWIAGKISDILGNEDDVVIELCFNLIEGSRYVC
jgi:serine/arginine repetitive matrix protein 1